METLLTGLLRLPLLGSILERFLYSLHSLFSRAMRRARRESVRPREWSNNELKKIAGAFDGEVINVSGWRDEDQRGGHYRDYFSNAATYTVSNFRGARGLEETAGAGLFIDLEAELPVELHGRYQVAFNHTTLEHVFDIRLAIKNICELSNETVILVTPFLQPVHFEAGSFGDYWRPTPMCINRILADNGFTTLYQSTNDTPWHFVYIFTVASRNPCRLKQVGQAPSELIVGLGHFPV